MLRSILLSMVCTQGAAWVRAPTVRPPSSRNGFLDDALDNVKSGLAKMSQTATVQHVLVPSRTTALKLQREAEEEGVSPEVIGRLAQQYSTCGSAQKTPDASFKMLRGRPGELTFKRGEMAKEFEEVSFTAPVGSLSVVDTQFGSHLIYINARDDADPKTSRGKKSKKQKGFGVRGGFVAPTTPARPSSHLAASKLPPLVEKLQLLVPLGFVAQISFLVASNQISGPENLEEYGRIGTEYLKTNTDFSGPRGEVMRIQSEAQQIWWNNVLRDLEAGKPVKPPITAPYPKYELFKGAS